MEFEWPEVFLEDVANELTVGFVGPMADQYVPVGIPFLRSLNVEPLRVKTADLKYISPDFHLRLKKSALAPGDVVIVRTGKPGACVVIPDWLPVANCSDVVVVRCGHELNPHFLAYYVNAIAQDHVSAHLVGAVQQHFNVGAARKIKIPLPSLEEQAKIVETLRSIDIRKDILDTENKSLEAIARAIFKSWFVDFDPVRAKAEGREPEGMDAATAALFPDAFEDSELGAIPKGWRVGSILAIATLLSGGTPKTDRADYWGGPIDWASAKDVSQCRDAFLIRTERRITETGLAESSTKLIPAHCTAIVARGATTGRLALFGKEMAMNQTCYALSSTTKSPFALYCQLRNLVSELLRTAHGSVFETITTSTFSSSRISLPPPQILEAIEDSLRPLFQRILANTELSFTLGTIRGEMLPRLISGKLRVPEAEKLVEAVL